jgi:hypothetical protein
MTCSLAWQRDFLVGNDFPVGLNKLILNPLGIFLCCLRPLFGLVGRINEMFGLGDDLVGFLDTAFDLLAVAFFDAFFIPPGFEKGVGFRFYLMGLLDGCLSPASGNLCLFPGQFCLPGGR